MKKSDKIVSMFILMLVLILIFPLINAGPYGYNDSMDLKYKVVDGKVVYGYGESTKYITSLRPLDKNWSDWKLDNEGIVRREIVNLTWSEINEVIKEGFSFEEVLKAKKGDNFIVNNPPVSGITYVLSFFLELLESKQVPVKKDITTNEGWFIGGVGDGR